MSDELPFAEDDGYKKVIMIKFVDTVEVNGGEGYRYEIVLNKSLDYKGKFQVLEAGFNSLKKK